MILVPNGHNARRPSIPVRFPTAPVIMNGNFAEVGHAPTEEQYENGIQIINGDKQFNTNLNTYLRVTKTACSGFDYHLISVFGSQSTGKSTLLNHLFGTQFGVMSETERRQTTKGIWMSTNKQQTSEEDDSHKMAGGILIMDVEGTDGRERGEDQDFERKSALFALATSEVLIVNIWEHQVGLYQGANMGLLKTVFEVNLQLFLKDKQSTPRSLLFFVIRDHLGTTPLSNLRKTLKADLSNIWMSLSKPAGLEKSRIDDYFDFAFAALPHKILQPEKFSTEVKKLGKRFRVGQRPASNDSEEFVEESSGIFLPEYHRRIPADGFSVYAEGVWEQILSNKDLDLPSQQELLAQFRCDEISREVVEQFNVVISPHEEKQAEGIKRETPVVLENLGAIGRAARENSIKAFENEASRYHKAVFLRKRDELEVKIDTKLKILFRNQILAAHKCGIALFTHSICDTLNPDQKRNTPYEFAEIVATEKKIALVNFDIEVKNLFIDGVSWTHFPQEYQRFNKELDLVSASLRKDEMRRLALRTERWLHSRLAGLVGLEFNKLGTARRIDDTFEIGRKPSSEKEFWDRVWNLFTLTFSEAGERFSERAKSLDSDKEEIERGLWRLRRKSWIILRAKLDEEVKEGNIMTKLRENFEDKFRYDESGIPRIWRPIDDIEGIYTKAKDSTLCLIPRLSKFILSSTQKAPPLPVWIGEGYQSNNSKDEEDFILIGGVDDEDGKTLEDEMMILGDERCQDLTARFKKQADSIYIEAKRSAIGGMAKVPFYFWILVLFLGWNEFLAVLRNPMFFLLLLITGSGAYVAWSLNLWGPILSMTNAATTQGINIGKEKLREFLEKNEAASRRLILEEKNTSQIGLETLNSQGKKKENEVGI